MWVCQCACGSNASLVSAMGCGRLRPFVVCEVPAGYDGRHEAKLGKNPAGFLYIIAAAMCSHCHGGVARSHVAPGAEVSAGCVASSDTEYEIAAESLLGEVGASVRAFQSASNGSAPFFATIPRDHTRVCAWGRFGRP